MFLEHGKDTGKFDVYEGLHPHAIIRTLQGVSEVWSMGTNEPKHISIQTANKARFLMLHKRPELRTHVTDREGNAVDEFNNAHVFVTSHRERNRARSPQELQMELAVAESMQRKAIVEDIDGRPVCAIQYNPFSNCIHEVLPFPYTDTDHGAEKHEEKICCTGEEGQLINTNETRASAREKGLRYLVVSTLLHHGNEVLLQMRSKEKQIDAGKFSTSAHGVATKLNLGRLETTNNVSIINTALELNEELRFGEGIEPFHVIAWPGTATELQIYARATHFDDENVAFLIPQKLYAEGGYPLGDTSKKRTRAVSAAFIFSKDTPTIAIDPAELSDFTWQKPSTFVDDARMTEDLQACVRASYDDFERSAWMDGTAQDHLIRRALGERF